MTSTTTPTCCYCHDPIVTVDPESGYPDSYHGECLLPQTSGRFAVVQTSPDGTQSVVVRYSTFDRANGEAIHLTKSNPQCNDADWVNRFHDGQFGSGWGTSWDVLDTDDLPSFIARTIDGL